MKYERKNKKMKEIAVGTVSNVNLPLTLAIRHQLQLCYVHEFSEVNMRGKIVRGPNAKHNAYLDLKRIVPGLRNDASVKLLNSVEIVGKVFSNGIIFISKIADDEPVFGKIKNIFCCDDAHIYFHIHQFHTICFNQYYHAYDVVSNTYDSDVLINTELLPKLPPCVYIIKNNVEMVATKYDA